MGIPGGKKTKTGYSTSVDVLASIMMEKPSTSILDGCICRVFFLSLGIFGYISP
jgi:hypothetical protein